MTMKPAKRGVILMNLGSPDSTEVKDVRRYLMQFLMDKRVIDKPYLLRLPLVGGIIVPFRAPKSAEAYKEIWTKEGSPLIVLTQQLQQAVQPLLSEPVEIAMRYGNPTVQHAFDSLVKKVNGLEEVIAVPLYPHYAMSSYETAVEHAREVHRKKKYPFRLRFIKPFYNDPGYINAMVESMKPFVSAGGFDHILFSYHGIPARHLAKGDPTGSHSLGSQECCQTPSPGREFCYRYQCFETTRLVTEKLGIPADKHSISFQSRLGKGWLEPFTDVRLEEMPKEGTKKILILCPAFVSDCLETLEEIAMRGKDTFMEAGGESYTFIPCLNTHPLWVETIAAWIKAYNAGETNMLLKEPVYQ
ncbi:MAG: ferrochelatase [Chitinophagaceae bacterium]|nr:ferrochelatase [Chitinophagaceae bacterium]